MIHPLLTVLRRTVACGVAPGTVPLGAAAGLMVCGLLMGGAPIGGGAWAAEVILPAGDPALAAANRDRGSSDGTADSAGAPDIVALAEALVDAATRREVLAPTTPVVGGASLHAHGLRASLRPETEIERDVILLGDVFGGLPSDAARVPVAYAPGPGERLVMDSGYLSSLATEYGVNWSPASRFVQAEVSRRGYEVGRQDVVTALRDHLLAAGMPLDGVVSVNSLNVRAMVGSPEEVKVGILDLYYDERTRRFNALVEVPAGSPESRSIRLTGSVYVAVEVPVLRRPVRRDMEITEDDLAWKEVRDTDVRPDILMDPSDLVDHVARNGIQAGQPVRANQVRLPNLVTRNDLITMVVETPFLTVTARGRALEDGSRGETVRVENLTSEKELLAVVQGQNTVVVRPELLVSAR